VKNEGGAASGSFTMQWWSTHAKVACTWTVPSLAPGESVTRTCPYTYGGWNPAYDIKLVIDSGNAVAETNEDNNVFARKLKVNDAP
jgi:subtilase family serine protease